MVEDKELEVVVDEKSAKDFLQSKRAISFMLWVIVMFVATPLAKLAIPELELDTELLINRGSEIVAILILGYSGQDIVGVIADIIAIVFYGKANNDE